MFSGMVSEVAFGECHGHVLFSEARMMGARTTYSPSQCPSQYLFLVRADFAGGEGRVRGGAGPRGESMRRINDLASSGRPLPSVCPTILPLFSMT
jgi:hypothetical protein